VPQNVLLCFINDTNGTNYINFTQSCLNNGTGPQPKPDPSYIIPIDEGNATTGVNNTNETKWILVSMAGGMDQDKNLDVLKDASKFNDSRILGMIFLSN
jgi:hypothetical protein